MIVQVTFLVAGALLLGWVSWLLLRDDLGRADGSFGAAGLGPESDFKVVVGDQSITVTRPDGGVEICRTAGLREISIVTSASGPWGPDVWWLFVGADDGCTFPGGSIGEREALHFAQQLPGFDNAEFVTAMGSTGDANFLCWKAPESVS